MHASPSALKEEHFTFIPVLTFWVHWILSPLASCLEANLFFSLLWFLLFSLQTCSSLVFTNYSYLNLSNLPSCHIHTWPSLCSQLFYHLSIEDKKRRPQLFMQSPEISAFKHCQLFWLFDASPTWLSPGTPLRIYIFIEYVLLWFLGHKGE